MYNYLLLYRFEYVYIKFDWVSYFIAIAGFWHLTYLIAEITISDKAYNIFYIDAANIDERNYVFGNNLSKLVEVFTLILKFYYFFGTL